MMFSLLLATAAWAYGLVATAVFAMSVTELGRAGRLSCCPALAALLCCLVWPLAALAWLALRALAPPRPY